MKIPKLLAFTVAVTPLASPIAGQDRQDRTVAAITADDFAWRVGVIAHDSMLGRDTPSPGLDMTAHWVASEFRSMGLAGGAKDGAFLQRYPLWQVSVAAARSRATSGDRVTLRFGDDLAPLLTGPAQRRHVGEVVVVSGSTDVEAALSGGALGGRHVLLVPARGARVDQSTVPLLRVLMGAGPASLMVVSWDGDEAWRRRSAAALRPRVRFGNPPADPSPSARPVLLSVRAPAAASLLGPRGVSLTELAGRSGGPARAEVLPGLTLDLAVELETRSTSAPNVVGLLEGSDPQLRDEYVVFSAHMDHDGVRPPNAQGDSVMNGADDDASGTAAVMEVAEAMAAMDPAPRRSMIFLVVSGEEKGLWGSQYYAENPSVPLDRLVANLNADMVGRNWTDTIVAIGKEHSDLGETLDRVNRAHPELGMTAIDDLWPEERFYFRSDHYNFAKRGVPVLFFFNGTHEDYHGLDDEPEKIDSEKAARIARLLFHLGAEVGNAEDRPRWEPESYRRIVSEVR